MPWNGRLDSISSRIKNIAAKIDTVYSVQGNRKDLRMSQALPDGLKGWMIPGRWVWVQSWLFTKPTPGVIQEFGGGVIWVDLLDGRVVSFLPANLTPRFVHVERKMEVKTL